MKIVCLISGGIDSTTLLFKLVKNNHKVFPLYVNYGHKSAKQELCAAKKACKLLKLKLNHIDISGLSLISSGLTDNKISFIKYPVFPNRNIILLSIASAFASNYSCNVIAIGLTAGSDFADQTKKFVKNTESVLSFGTKTIILTPLIELNKLEVVRLANDNNIPLYFTYSCYGGAPKTCGKCLGCRDRKNTFSLEGLT